MSSLELKRFDIQNGEITRVYEWDDGRWESEPIEWDETYRLDGQDVIKTESDDGYIETTVYRERGDGLYAEVAEYYSRPGGDVMDQALYVAGDEMSSLELKRFDIQNGEITRVYEWDDGRWESESIEWGETYRLDGQDVIKTESDDGYIETTAYRDRGDGLYAEVAQHYSRPESQTMEPTLQDDAALVRLYLSVFDREPDASGFNYWNERLDRSLSYEQVADHFLGSAEFQRDYAGADDAAFVSRLYDNILSREADQEGLGWWTQQLESGHCSRQDVVLGFVQSEEFIAESVDEVHAFLQVNVQPQPVADLLLG